MPGRPTIGTAAGEATVAGRECWDGTRPTTGPTTHRQSNSHYTKSYQNFGSTSPCPAAGTAAGGATVVGRRHRDGTRLST
ncbi:hypothetical protein ACLOJK_027207, partial [Asimina triloba]